LTLASLPLDGPGGAFHASLESLDGAASIPLAGLGYQTDLFMAGGFFTSVNYTGPVSMLQAGAAVNGEIFGDDALVPGSEGAVIRIDNLGGPVTLSWPDGSVRNAFQVTLEGRWFSIGAAGGPVELTGTPEPATFGLLVGGLLVFACYLPLRKRRPHAADRHVDHVRRS
jgi:hypothetical protein